jgi:hypothetical protein
VTLDCQAEWQRYGSDASCAAGAAILCCCIPTPVQFGNRSTRCPWTASIYRTVRTVKKPSHIMAWQLELAEPEPAVRSTPSAERATGSTARAPQGPEYPRAVGRRRSALPSVEERSRRRTANLQRYPGLPWRRRTGKPAIFCPARACHCHRGESIRQVLPGPRSTGRHFAVAFSWVSVKESTIFPPRQSKEESQEAHPP